MRFFDRRTFIERARIRRLFVDMPTVSLDPPRVQLASIERSLAEVTAIQRQLGIKVDEDEDEEDLEVGLLCPCFMWSLVAVPRAGR